MFAPLCAVAFAVAFAVTFVVAFAVAFAVALGGNVELLGDGMAVVVHSCTVGAAVVNAFVAFVSFVCFAAFVV